MKELIVRTRQTFGAPARTVWTLLCDSRMDSASSIWFKLGVPQPVECRVPDGHGGVGSVRQCVSDQGIVHQRIFEWVPERRLAFRMEGTNMRFRRYVSEIVDTFDLASVGAGVLVTRTTHVTVKGSFQILKKVGLFFSLKQVHRYVFRNWRQLARGDPPGSPQESGTPPTLAS
jgi:Polyketide cyclase / dehydrase and lipid transport